ncbi:hypothetical protein ACJJTC_010756 [Scirpophaga incertulas]
MDCLTAGGEDLEEFKLLVWRVTAPAITWTSEENADTLFPSEDEVQPPPSKKHRKSKQAVSQPAAKPVVRASSLAQVSTAAAPLPVAACSSSSKKPYFKPIPPKIATAYDLFGTDSEDDEKADIPTTGKSPSPLTSYVTRRLANGHSRQIFDRKPGTHYVDLKIYRCDEIEKVQPINRWRQAIVTVKNKTFDNTGAWQHLANFIRETRKEFVNCPQTYVSNYYSN